MNDYHFLVVSFPFQSHINPTLRLATKLINAGARVTFVTTVYGLNNFHNRPSLHRLSYDSFSDGFDDGPPKKPGYHQQIKLVASTSLKKLLLTKANDVDFLIYGISLPWVAEVARDLHLPSALFFFQSAASFSLIYHFFKSDGSGLVNSKIDPTGTVQIPGLHLLIRESDLPEYCRLTDPIAAVFQDHIQTLEKHPNPLVIINTFDALEEETIKTLSVASGGINIFSLGPLTDVILDYSDRESSHILRWLDSKPEKSVVYLSFGSFVELQKKQKDEMLHGLIESGYSFLWVIRGNDDEEVKRYMAMAEDEERGLIVRWCSQVEVLNHVSIGCFVTHGGWNSMVESMVSGVAVVGWPQFADQMVNVKMAEEVWGNGAKAVADGEGVVRREELKRCLEEVMGGGGGGREIKRNCEKLKSKAVEAVADGGSSQRNFKKLLQSLKGGKPEKMGVL